MRGDGEVSDDQPVTHQRLMLGQMVIEHLAELGDEPCGFFRGLVVRVDGGPGFRLENPPSEGLSTW